MWAWRAEHEGRRGVLMAKHAAPPAALQPPDENGERDCVSKQQTTPTWSVALAPPASLSGSHCGLCHRSREDSAKTFQTARAGHRGFVFPQWHRDTSRWRYSHHRFAHECLRLDASCKYAAPTALLTAAFNAPRATRQRSSGIN